MQFCYVYLVPLAIGYALGSISFAIISCRLIAGVDPREVGSRNPGTANVYQNVSKTAGWITGIFDIAKGLGAVAIAHLITDDPVGWGLAGIGSVVGHCWPVWFGFRGGKGGGPVFGALCGLIPLEIWTAIWVFLIVYTIVRHLGFPKRFTPLLLVPLMLAAPALALHLGRPLAVVLVAWANLGLVVIVYLASFFVRRGRPATRGTAASDVAPAAGAAREPRA